MYKENKAVNLLTTLATFALVFTGLLAIAVDLGPALSANQSNSVNANVVVASSCQVSLSPTAIAFNALDPGASDNTNVVVTDTNTGNLQDWIWLYGGNWLLGASFGFSGTNTDWANTIQSSFTGTPLSNTIAINTLIGQAAGNANDVYFGVTIPNGQAAGTYNQVITFLNVC